MAARRNARQQDDEAADLFGGASGNGSGGSGGHSAPPGGEDGANLHELAQARYLNYALSVITSRALPDVRDGMKPVHRRIIYTMWQNEIGRAASREREDKDGRGQTSIY